jgi:hypothetical protein
MTEGSLRKRFDDYLRECKSDRGRPKVLLLLNAWRKNVEFCCVTYSRNPKLMEDQLIGAFLPPFNDQFPAQVRKIVKAF